MTLELDTVIPAEYTNPNKLPYAHEKTHAFLKNRIAAGAFIIPEEVRETREGDMIARENNIMGSYYMSPATHDKLGEIYRDVKNEYP